MAITASQLTAANTLDEFRREFNKLVTDVSDIQSNNIFGVGISFEGSSADAYETALQVVNPTADRTVLIPNEDGTLLTTGSSITAGTVSVSDNESTSENNAILFAADAAYTGNVSVESDGDLHYNPSSGTVTATTFSGALSGNATTATALATGRTIASTGDVVWTSASFDGSGNVTGTAAIGTGVIVNADVKSDAAIAMSKTALVAGTGITLSTNTLNVDAAQSQITSVGTLTGLVIADDGNIGSASDTDALTIDASGNVTASQNLTITGNLTVNGATVTNSAANTVIEDTLIELNTGAGSNANDIGFIMERGSTGDNAFMGWDESADKFIVGTTTSDGSATGNLTITTGTLVANLEGNVTGTLQTAAQTNITSVGALDGGSITSNFGTINTGSSTITTTGNITGGTLTSTGNVVIADAGNIGSASDTDAIAISAAGVTTFSQRAEFSSDLYLNGDEKELRWYNGSNYVGFTASSSLAGNQIWVLPTGDASSNGDALVSDGSGNLSFSSTVGSNASSVTAADESSDTSCFPLFATAATGNVSPKTGSNLTFNSSSGALTATSFVGDLTGNVSGSAATVTGSAQSAITSVGTLTSVVIADGGNIGSATDTDAISIASDGDVTFTQEVELTNAGDAILKITADTDNSNENDTAQIILSQDGGATTGHFHLDNTNGLVINNASTAPGTTKIQNQGNTAIEIPNTLDVEFKDDAGLSTDGKDFKFGVNHDVRFRHVHNIGLELRQSNTAAIGATFTFNSLDTAISATNTLGKIEFKAGSESSGSDAILPAAYISAVAEGTFSASNNATKIDFATGISETATPAMSLSSTGELSFPNKQGGDNLLLDQTAAAGTDGGDDVILNGTDGSSTNADSNIIFEDAVVLTTQTDRHLMKRMMGEFGEEMKSAFPNRMRLIDSTGATLRTLYCAGDSDGS